MAIIVEEDRQDSIKGTSSAFGWFIIVGIILAAAYYIFFAPAPDVTVPPPPHYAVIAPIAQISLDPQSELQSPAFQALKSYIPEPTSTSPAVVGKTDPFMP